MRDIFTIIDNWQSKLNVFQDPKYLRKVVVAFSLSMFIPWALLGFDSGVGMLEIWNNNWQINYTVYGKSFHFSAFIIYGLLFYGLSKHMEDLGIEKSQNISFSCILVLLNISIFELVYMATFAHYQMNRNLVEWLVTDFWFLQQYILILGLGALGFLAFYIERYIIVNKKTVGRKFSFYPNKRMVALLWLTVSMFVFWIHYPFPIETVTLGNWVSSPFFPQTHYAYVNTVIYVQNDLLHLVNLIVKSLFAFSQFYILSRFMKARRESLCPRCGMLLIVEPIDIHCSQYRERCLFCGYVN